MTEFKDYLESNPIEIAEKHFNFQKGIGYYDYYCYYKKNLIDKPSIHVFISNSYDNKISIFKYETKYYIHNYIEHDCGGYVMEQETYAESYDQVIQYLYKLERY